MQLNLNNKQKEAINNIKGNLLIVASAGTGKTTTIVNRYINMVETHNFLPEEIMMTTFTNKAAKDMTEKIKKYTNKVPKYIGTLHSIFLKILRTNYKEARLKENFILLSEENDKRKIIKELLRKNLIQDNYENTYYFLSWISRFKNRGILAEELNAEGSLNSPTKSIEEVMDDEVLKVSSELKQKVNLIYKKYQEYLKINNMLDFDDVLIYTLKLFKENKPILDYYKNKFKAIMVDEAQDLNIVQIKILELLENNNLCLIGDDCQNIYEWRGASNELVFDFSQNKPVIYLEENYRSREKIISAVNQTINEMRFKIDKKLQCSRDLGDDINVSFHDNLRDEASGVIRRVKELIENKVKESDIVVLFRTNFIGNFFEKEFLRNKIPCHFTKAKGFFDREEIKDFLSFLKLKVNPNSEIDFKRVVMLAEQVGETKLNEVIEYARSEGIDLVEALNYYKKFEINSIASRNLKKLQDLIQDLDKSPVKQFLDDFNYEGHVELVYSGQKERLLEKRANLKLLRELYIDYEESHHGAIRFLDELIEIDKNEDTKNKVILSTIHSAKGLEWKHVFLVCCNEGILPYYRDELGTTKRDSELRLFYVAISRAKDNLYVSGSRTHNWNEYTPSHFLELVY